MARPKTHHRTSREDDFRDYDDRSIREGWPYADEDAIAAEENGAYGASESNFDRADGPAAEIADDPAIESEGGPALDPASADDAIADDALEETIVEMLEEHDLNGNRFTVTVHDAVATIAGRVETPEERVVLTRLILSVPGVRNVVDELHMTGVDSHIPPDAND